MLLVNHDVRVFHRHMGWGLAGYPIGRVASSPIGASEDVHTYFLNTDPKLLPSGCLRRCIGSYLPGARGTGEEEEHSTSRVRSRNHGAVSNHRLLSETSGVVNYNEARRFSASSQAEVEQGHRAEGLVMV